ncbi:MAG TPA: PhoH family protein [Casimicrobiaceae bacterium]|nr:PhoH family protein [Casimicrobiaceae bacterium]
MVERKLRLAPQVTKPSKIPSPKLFVLDTNVLMHDPTSLFRFEEHHIFLPILTLEELDNNKKGVTEVARNARQASRYLDELVTAAMAISDGNLANGIPLKPQSGGAATGRLFLQTGAIPTTLPPSLAGGKADNQIIAVVMHLSQAQPGRDVILVSKDINMRIKARALGIAAEDYTNDKVLEDTDLLYSGMRELPADFWDRHAKGMESWQQAGSTYYRVTGPLSHSLLINEFVYLEGDGPGERPLYAIVREVAGRTALLQTLKDYTHHKNNIWGITARNREQNFALNLLMNPEIDFVTLLGQAGTGKTLLTLAAGLMNTLEFKVYSEIIMTRVTVPVGEDIGFLPGTEEEKMNPWMGALEDNLDVLNKTDDEAGEWGRAATRDLIRSRIKVKSLNFMRGRTFINKYLIIDEAQNLTPKQMKTLITRAGPGTKVVCLGNIAQIDTPYLTEGSSGLTYVVDRFKGWSHSGHVTLIRGERSRLADHAAEIL